MDHRIRFSSTKNPNATRRYGTRTYATCSCGWQRQGNTRDDAELLAARHLKEPQHAVWA